MPPKPSPKAGAKPDAKSQATLKGSTKELPPVEVQLYSNDYTNKLKDNLRKQLQGTKGFPEKLKSVVPYHV